MAFPRLQELAAAQNSNNLTDAIAEFLKQLSQTKVLKMLEIRKSIAEVHMQVHKKIDFVTVMRSLFESDFVSLDPRLQSKKSAMDRSFTLGSTKEADNVKILQSCNGLLLTDIQKESQKRPNQARNGKDKVISKPKSVKIVREDFVGIFWEAKHQLCCEDLIFPHGVVLELIVCPEGTVSFGMGDIDSSEAIGIICRSKLD
ncbi:hypothetical protein Tco_1459384 [Tanacetum coccineum]